ncbi:MAG: non-canonical purine NTP diphosphatase [Bacteroidales bacterium]|jgi:XTP/dITP diphosphohydrolase|nr:non-canonical purine NTP diphosphatase [Bacteroidales bacterium]
MNLVFATHNQHKTDEIRHIIGNHFTIQNLKDIGCFEEIEETTNTLQGNALLKAQYVFNKYGINCFSDDTGLEIEALNGAPGVFSARYAGEPCSFEDNMNKVLKELKGITNRKASFKTVIALILDGNQYFFEGAIEGCITTEKMGIAGFGYDPIFLPQGYSKTFAALGDDDKNKISHRAMAVHKLINFLSTQS